MKFVERVCSARSASPARGTDSGHFQNAGRLDLAGVRSMAVTLQHGLAGGRTHFGKEGTAVNRDSFFRNSKVVFRKFSPGVFLSGFQLFMASTLMISTPCLSLEQRPCRSHRNPLLRLPGVRKGHPANRRREGFNGPLCQQCQDRLAGLVRLGQHGRASLLQDALAGEIRALGGHIHIDDPAVGGFQVYLVDGQEIGCE